jgi:hypothetical protein
MIDKHSGQITMLGISLSPMVTRSAFKLSADFGTWENHVGDTIAYFSYKRKLIDGQGRKLVLMVYFHQEQIKSVEMFFFLPDEKESGSWDDWSEQNELRRKAQHDQLLSDQLGAAPYEYKWGKVWSVYDQRSGDSRIIVSYA